MNRSSEVRKLLTEGPCNTEDIRISLGLKPEKSRNVINKLIQLKHIKPIAKIEIDITRRMKVNLYTLTPHGIAMARKEYNSAKKD